MIRPKNATQPCGINKQSFDKELWIEVLELKSQVKYLQNENEQLKVNIDNIVKSSNKALDEISVQIKLLSKFINKN